MYTYSHTLTHFFFSFLCCFLPFVNRLSCVFKAHYCNFFNFTITYRSIQATMYFVCLKKKFGNYEQHGAFLFLQTNLSFLDHDWNKIELSSFLLGLRGESNRTRSVTSSPFQNVVLRVIGRPHHVLSSHAIVL